MIGSEGSAFWLSNIWQSAVKIDIVWDMPFAPCDKFLVCELTRCGIFSVSGSVSWNYWHFNEFVLVVFCASSRNHSVFSFFFNLVSELKKKKKLSLLVILFFAMFNILMRCSGHTVLVDMKGFTQFTFQSNLPYWVHEILYSKYIYIYI